MDSAEQAAGEKRVMELLVQPLILRGLGKPSTQTKTEFVAMQREICQKLAYMTQVQLRALEEDAAAHPGGKDRDRFPILNNILPLALKIAQPSDDLSPLMIGVLRHNVGKVALREGWAPELIKIIKDMPQRSWPSDYYLKKAQDAAGANIRRLEGIERRLADGREVEEADLKFRTRRRAVMANLAEVSGGEG